MLANYFFVILFLDAIFCNQKLPSPCNHLLQLEIKDDQSDRWHAELHLTTDVVLNGISLKIALDRPVSLLGLRNKFGSVTTTDNTNFIITDNSKILEPQGTEFVHFFVKFKAALNIPQVSMIYLNGRQICPMPYNPIKKNIRDNQILLEKRERPNTFQRDGLSSKRSNRIAEFSYLPNILIINNETYIRSTTERNDNSSLSLRQAETTESSTDDYDDYSIEDDEETFEDEAIGISETINDPECGMRSLKPRPLILNGEPSKEGLWPWHVALYKQEINGSKLTYTCGGTLISKEYIITAAHCVTLDSTSNKALQADLFLVYLGKHSFKAFGSKIQNLGVETIYLHPFYNFSLYANDIAILKLSEPVQYTNWVRPACLWKNSVLLRKIVGSQGTVVGWGYGNNNDISEYLNHAKMPVVSIKTCKDSNPDLVPYITNTSYCAGFRNGTTVCNGDSGGGMFFSEEKDGVPKWFLRGLVSHGFALPSSQFCSHKQDQFIVFTDIAKYLKWIKSVIVK